MNEDKRKHLEFIQHIITRMNTNSFQIKKMAVTVIAAFIAIYVAQKDPVFLITPIVPLLVFWALDTYYLQQERKFRALYNDAVNNEILVYSMNIDKYKKGKYGFFNVFFSDTMCPLYLFIAILLVIVFFGLSF